MDPKIDIPAKGQIPYSKLMHRHKQQQTLGEIWSRQETIFCLCQGQPGIGMRVKLTQDPNQQFTLHTVIGSGDDDHHPDCPNAVADKPAPQAKSARRLRLSRPKQSRGTKTLAAQRKPIVNKPGLITLNLCYDTYREPAQAGEQARSSGLLTADKSRPATLTTLLETLWHLAGLNRWSMDEAFERNYSKVQSLVMYRARLVSINGLALGPRFLMPANTRQQEKYGKVRQITDLYRGMRPGEDGRQPYGYVVGLLHDWSCDEQGGAWLVVKHLRTRIYCEDAQYLKEQAQKFHFDGQGETVVAVQVSLEERLEGRGEPGDHTPGGQELRMCALAAIQIIDQLCWLPVESRGEADLCSELMKTGHPFTKPLEAGRWLVKHPVKSPHRPNFVVREDATSVFLYVLDRSHQAQHDKAMYGAEYASEHNIPNWVWDTSKPMPELPVSESA